MSLLYEILKNGASVWTVLIMWQPQMAFQLDAGDELFAAVFTHKFFISYVLTDVPSQSLQLLIGLWTPLTSSKYQSKSDIIWKKYNTVHIAQVFDSCFYLGL